jgi:hypothetical protein
VGAPHRRADAEVGRRLVEQAVGRLGTSHVVAAGLSGLAVPLAVTPLWEPTTGALGLVAWFLGAMGWVMADVGLAANAQRSA